jgi:hypothetical protein
VPFSGTVSFFELRFFDEQNIWIFQRWFFPELLNLNSFVVELCLFLRINCFIL